MTEKECDPIALITWHAGIAVDVNYSAAGSFAGMSKVVPAFKDYFKYAGTAKLLYRQFLSYPTWTDKLKTDLDAGQPIIYYGDDGTSGHAWICDGYQGTDMFHMNWGWSGNYNGYFNIDDLNAGGFSPDLNQAAVFGIKPDTSQYPYYCAGQSNVVHYNFGTIEDGSGPVSEYQDDASCSWLISPDDSVQNITLSFTEFNTNPSDKVIIYNGSTIDDPVLGVFSGQAIPSDIISTGPAMLVTFMSDGATTAGGWKAKYNCTLNDFCTGETILTDLSGTISDRSNQFQYRNNSSCTWKLIPDCNYLGMTTLKFTKFNTEEKVDRVDIFDLNSGSLLASYSGNYAIPPDSVTSPSGKMLIHFTTSPSVRNEGWEATYQVDCYNPGIFEKTIENLEIYPVPANDILNIGFNLWQRESVQIDIISVEGKNVYSENTCNFTGRFFKNIDVSILSQGIYFIKISTDTAISISKIIIQ